MKNASAARIGILLIIVALPIVILPFFGVDGVIGLEEQRLFWLIRIPRLLAGVLAGMAFGTAGLVFQTLFSNPLTTPFTLGIASGASFGATLAIITGFTGAILGLNGMAFGSLVGSLGVTSIMFLLSKKSSRYGSDTLLLSGVALSFFFASLMLFLSYLGDVSSSFRTARWLMGGLDVVGYESIVLLAPFVIIGVLYSISCSEELDVFATGEELAASRGLDVERLKGRLFLVLSCMIGVVVSVVGPIGFVGLILPHIAKSLSRSGHFSQLLICCMLSASFLVTCDFISRIILYPVELPIGILTAIIGVPFFLMILVRRS